ncbi:hypothetical protein [Gordonibacter massiliensis (ex Traore et al. 2017)]|uniref:hypothetical protein n=1 Tax=Gordonibacter massiliensis (ex Traore et al. 2017) TaxID=1841863 RepID=UPI001C8BE74F|nr:hypothetical protein [Gordonibacter massiliensis (ex Traore et al. 2017)]MBX9035112.1 hypothetical protein [Gordonibacter massiliensis (ex Traore et al. 2017)]
MGGFDGKAKWPFAVMAFVMLIAICVTVWAVFFRSAGAELAPDYAPQQEEGRAEPIAGDTGGKLEEPEGGGAVSLAYSKEVTVRLSAEEATLLFANPSKSNRDMILQIVVKDEVIVQSGLIKPGNQVTSLSLLEGAGQALQLGGYDGKFKVLYYSQSTSEKEFVSTEIPVSITVEE